MQFSLDLEEKHCTDNPAKDKVVKLYFPNLSEVVLHDLELENASYCEAMKNRHTLLVFGDSITQGYDAVHPGFSYTNILAGDLDLEVFNKAIGGDTFRPEVIDPEEKISPDAILVAYGTNDWSTMPHEHLKNTSEEFFRKLAGTYPAVPVYVILPIWRKDCDRITQAGTFPEARETIRLAASMDPAFTCIDGLELLPHVTSFYSDGYLHPNDHGFCCMAKKLLEKIRFPR